MLSIRIRWHNLRGSRCQHHEREKKNDCELYLSSSLSVNWIYKPFYWYGWNVFSAGQHHTNASEYCHHVCTSESKLMWQRIRHYFIQYELIENNSNFVMFLFPVDRPGTTVIWVINRNKISVLIIQVFTTIEITPETHLGLNSSLLLWCHVNASN